MKVFILTLMLCSSTALAQDFPRWELFGGTQHVQGNLGAVASVAFNPTRWLGIVLEGSGSSGGMDWRCIGACAGTSAPGPNFSSHELSFLAGPQLSYRAGWITPFARVMAGGSNLKYRTSMSWNTSTDHGQMTTTEHGQMTTTYNLTRLKLALGGGVDLGNEHVAGRVAIDYMPVKLNADWSSSLRVSGGIVVKF